MLLVLSQRNLVAVQVDINRQTFREVIIDITIFTGHVSDAFKNEFRSDVRLILNVNKI